MDVKSFGKFKIVYRRGSVDEEILTDASFENDIFFKAVPEYVPKETDVIIDVGAHIGSFSILASSKVGKVFAIEPSKESFELLQKNIELNKINNIVACKVALNGVKGQTKLYHNVKYGNWGHSITKEFSDDYEIVDTVCMDTFFEDNNIKFCDFMKFNCEGAEFPIILNASKEVLKKIGAMLILYHQDLVIDYSKDEIIRSLKQNRFNIKLIKVVGERGWIIAMR